MLLFVARNQLLILKSSPTNQINVQNWRDTSAPLRSLVGTNSMHKPIRALPRIKMTIFVPKMKKAMFKFAARTQVQLAKKSPQTVVKKIQATNVQAFISVM